MVLTAGSRLGVYEVTALIGEGGMGEVYRARDTVLHRDVALKVLPELLAADPERVARFKREAQVLASLNHPNIAAIYGFAEGQALVMELVEGPTLADRIAQGPLPLDEALPVARQIADALQDAHEHGVIHRDLKPANIKVKPDGTLKVLDFGLAKAFEGEPATAPGFSIAPTITSPAATGLGVILGTAAYMSPEQARGKAVDKRTDIWAFGCVLYEMLTGRRAFDGEEITDVLAAIVLKEPDWRTLPPSMPSPIMRLLRRCLQKDRMRRLADVSDVRLELDEALAATDPQEHVTPREAKPRAVPGQTLRIAAMALGGLSVMLLAVLAWSYYRTAPDNVSVYQFPVGLPASVAWEGTTARVSPDGTKIAYIGVANGRRLIWVHHLDTSVAQPLDGTDGVSFPFWSPDSRSLAFSSEGSLKRIDASGGPPITLCSLSEFAGGTWNADGVIVVASGGRLLRMAAGGGEPMPVHDLKGSWPEFLPDGEHFFYVDSGDVEQGGIYVGALTSPDPKLISRTISNVAYAAGHIVFVRETSLFAQTFDARQLQTTGEAVPIAEGIQVGGYGISFRGAFWASDRVLVYRASPFANDSRPAWFDRSGRRLGVSGEPAPYADIEVAPDGTHVAASIADLSATTRDLWILDLTRGLRTRLTFDRGNELAPVWHPDGTRLIFNSSQNGRFDLYSKAADGSGEQELVLRDAMDKWATSWSRDGGFVLYHTDVGGLGSSNRYDLFVLPINGDQKPRPFLRTPFNEYVAQFSPDGRWVAYVSNESGRTELYVTAFPKPVGKWQISVAGSTAQHRWGSDGREMFYVSPDGRMMAAEVDGTGPSFAVGAVKPLFDVNLSGARLAFDVSSDGQRFLINTAVGDGTATSPMTAVVNWSARLPR